MPVRAQQRHVISAATAMTPIPLNIHDGNAQTSWAMSNDGSGSVSYKIQFTLDDVLDADVSAVWFDSVSAQTGTNVGVIATPITGIRANYVTVSASSNATFRVIQSGV